MMKEMRGMPFWSSVEVVLKKEATGFKNGLVVKCKKKRGAKDDFKVWRWKNIVCKRNHTTF